MKKILILLLIAVSFSANAQRKLFGLDLNPTPALDFRIAVGQVGSPSVNMTMQNVLDFTTANLDVYTQTEVDNLFTNYISKTSLTTYTPTQPTHPATKGYVDDQLTSVKAQTGSVQIGDVVMKWGRVAVSTNNNIPVNFAVNFPTACQSVSLVYYGGDDKGSAENLMVFSVTNSVLTISDGGGTDATHIMWVAIGY